MPGYAEDVVIINREKPVNITDVDKETNIKLETTTAIKMVRRVAPNAITLIKSTPK